MKPDQCTSFHCNCYGCYYCSECSHAVYFGRGTDRNGKRWAWEFSPRFGPLFLKKDGTERKRQPMSENHPAWSAFEPWLWRHDMNDFVDMWQ